MQYTEYKSAINGIFTKIEQCPLDEGKVRDIVRNYESESSSIKRDLPFTLGLKVLSVMDDAIQPRGFVNYSGDIERIFNKLNIQCDPLRINDLMFLDAIAINALKKYGSFPLQSR